MNRPFLLGPTERLAVRGYDNHNRHFANPATTDLSEQVRLLGHGDSEFIVLLRIPYMPHDSMQASRSGETGPISVSFRIGEEPWMEADVPADEAPALFLAWAREEPGWQGDHAWEQAEWWLPADTAAPDPETATWAAGQAQRFIDEGYLEFEEIVQNLHEMTDSDQELSTMQARAITTPLWRARVAEQADWGVTDCEVLTAAFEELDGRGIVAREHFTCCQNCGSTEIWDEAGSETRGYVFFHMQDTERAVHGSLHLAYGARSNEPEDVAAIGREVVEVLNANGLDTEWDGSDKSRIEVVDLDWKRKLQ